MLQNYCYQTSDVRHQRFRCSVQYSGTTGARVYRILAISHRRGHPW